jgi:hypothetical protein
VSQVRLIQNGRVVAAGGGSPATLSVYGRNLGAGTSHIQAEAVFTDGRTARSAPVNLTIAYAAGAPLGQQPFAYSYTKAVSRGRTFVVELPARFDDALSGTTFDIVSPPSQGTTVGAATGSYRIMTAAATACGQDQFTFRVTTPSGSSNIGTVTLLYGSGAACAADINGDNAVNALDFGAFINTYAAGDLRADMDGNCALNVLDFGAYLNAFAAGCP